MLRGPQLFYFRLLRALLSLIDPYRAASTAEFECETCGIKRSATKARRGRRTGPTDARGVADGRARRGQRTRAAGPTDARGGADGRARRGRRTRAEGPMDARQDQISSLCNSGSISVLRSVTVTSEAGASAFFRDVRNWTAASTLSSITINQHNRKALPSKMMM